MPTRRQRALYIAITFQQDADHDCHIYVNRMDKASGRLISTEINCWNPGAPLRRADIYHQLALVAQEISETGGVQLPLA